MVALVVDVRWEKLRVAFCVFRENCGEDNNEVSVDEKRDDRFVDVDLSSQYALDLMILQSQAHIKCGAERALLAYASALSSSRCPCVYKGPNLQRVRMLDTMAGMGWLDIPAKITANCSKTFRWPSLSSSCQQRG